MDIITIEGDALSALLVEAMNGPMPYRLRIMRNADGLQFSLDTGAWSPPYPEAAEDVRRRARELPRGVQIGDHNTQTNRFA